MSVQQAHEKMGYINERVMKEIAMNLGWSLTYTQSTIELCCLHGRKSQAKVTQETKCSRS